MPADNQLIGVIFHPDSKGFARFIRFVNKEDQNEETESLKLISALSLTDAVFKSEMVLQFYLHNSICTTLSPVLDTAIKFKAHPHSAFIDLLHAPMTDGSRINWQRVNEKKRELRCLVDRLMPRVIEAVKVIAQYSSARKPYFTEDRSDPRKFIGLSCCGPTARTLAILLLANGVHAEEAGTRFFDHDFVVIPTTLGIDLYIDPTYKQLFNRMERQTELYWYKEPPYLLGTVKDFKTFYQTHRKLKDPFQGHYWIRSKSEFNNSDLKEALRMVLDEKFARELDENAEGKIIKRFLLPHEIGTLKKYNFNFSSTLAPKSGARNFFPLETFVRLGLKPYIEKFLHHYDVKNPLREGDLSFADYKVITSVFVLCGHILREHGYEVHMRGNCTNLEYFYHLSVKDSSGVEQILVPLVGSVLAIFGMKTSTTDKSPHADQFLLTNKAGLENIIKIGLRDREKELYPSGFKLASSFVDTDDVLKEFETFREDSHNLGNSYHMNAAQAIIYESQFSGEMNRYFSS